MPEEVSNRAVHYRGQAEKFRRLADMEDKPLARSRPLDIADDYQHLADTGPRKPSAELLGTRARNNSAAASVSTAGMAKAPSRSVGGESS